MATNVATPSEEQAELEVRQALIEAGGDPSHVNGLTSMGLWLTLNFVRAGRSVAKLCPPPTPAWDLDDRYGEFY